ncbi:NAD(P)/FAD-dependent oxidoreductase [Acidimicrobiia bacterium EGI L10123]|uniref:flavin-containing monooxygenase n=1 Tax=Salinilacustrithrix flava TaxID=2957203 RepID=UPI003D7C2FDE|nr:NAD(P)/FAD-dependent oxidoreductase [Acidimicrobiia bacterium EGI L10123]
MSTEHLDVLVVGAGLSGIGAGHYLQAECPWASYAIFEARDAIGGTWDLFRYPGIRSDSDMYTLGYSFRPWTGEKSIADGASILEYIRETARVEGIDRKIRFNHRVVTANWSTEDARWEITAERTDPDRPDAAPERVELTAGFVFSCSGYYRYDHGYQPDFPGMDDFAGEIVHPQHWPADLDYAGKQVVVIGSGATAVTLVPSMADPGDGSGAEHVTMLQRSPSYVVSMPAKNPLARLLQRLLPTRLSGPIVKWMNALGSQGFFQLSQRFPGVVKKLLRRRLEGLLPEGYDIDTHFTPSYDPWDQRVCLVPDGDLFRAIRDGSVSVVTDHIDTFTETGIRLRSGRELAADIVVTATGLELLFIGGIEASVDGEPVDIASKLTYKGMMLEGVPNLALAIGYTNASWTLKCDLTCDYVTRMLNHMHDTGLRQATPVNADSSVTPAPLLGLSSGYIQRAADRFPKQGSRMPWQVHQSYLRDYRALKRSEVTDGVMVFSNPTSPAVEAEPATVAS